MSDFLCFADTGKMLKEVLNEDRFDNISAKDPKWDDKNFISKEEAKMLGDSKFDYVPWHELNADLQKQAEALYTHKTYIDKSQYYYPITKDGKLGRGRRVIAIPYRFLQDDEYIKSIGYEKKDEPEMVQEAKIVTPDQATQQFPGYEKYPKISEEEKGKSPSIFKEKEWDTDYVYHIGTEFYYLKDYKNPLNEEDEMKKSEIPGDGEDTEQQAAPEAQQPAVESPKEGEDSTKAEDEVPENEITLQKLYEIVKEMLEAEPTITDMQHIIVDILANDVGSDEEKIREIVQKHYEMDKKEE